MSSKFIRNWFKKDTTTRAIKVALIVGPIPILIGQYDDIINGEFNNNFLLKSVLTLLVPYRVSAYSSASAHSSKEKN